MSTVEHSGFLSAWDKLGIMALGGAVVGLTVLLVVCAVGPGCCLYRIIHGSDYENVKSRKSRRTCRPRVRIGGATSFCEDISEDEDENENSEYERIIPMSPMPEKQNQINEAIEQYHAGKVSRGLEVYREKLPRQQRSDSTYGSMSSGRSSPVGGGMSIGNAFSTLSLSLGRVPSVKRSVAVASPPPAPLSPSSSSSSVATTSAAHRTSSLPKDPKEKCPLTSVNLSLALTSDQANINENGEASNSSSTMGSLIITIHDLKNLPARDYCSTRDPFVRISVLKDRRSLRKRSKQVLAEFNTRTVRHQLNPIFEQSFTAELPISDIKNVRVKVVALDYDRHTKTSPIGSTSIPLKDVKTLTSTKEPTRITNFLPQKKQEFGEIMFGLSYLPTAQRVSFSILKATNLKFDEVVENVETFRPYVRIVQMNQSGKVVKKKKTVFQEGTKEPVFNETLNFDVSHNQLDTVSFVILLSHKRQSFSDDEMQHLHDETISGLTDRSESGASAPSSARRSHSPLLTNFPNSNSGSVRGRDNCIGRVCIGANVRGEKERGHWISVMSSPRKVFTMWQTLY